ncbi:unnamed protein product [Bursaphelenchus okinawaensis]|uniref:Poly [ADP-ribose] polymerase n=1 Tax=Bursaphelenchus okinawaensis TaxID=465554 RepID=A0A811L6X7_9BILA|nr:unnamed protein product [Bursaphelenchus okinawaensis]CAG9117934.1 unnamed protein product [Bursaphelenchus okinawaensis]
MNDPRIADVIDDILKTNDGRKSDVARGLLFNDQVPFVEEVINTTQGPTHDSYQVKVEAVYDIERPGNNFKGPVTNHKLLFHGTPKENVYYMLRDGFKKAILSEKSPFGKGYYFTTCASKALNFTNSKAKDAPEQADEGEISPPEGVQYLFLTEVALGKSKDMTKPERTVSKFMQDATSVYGKGIHRPTEKFEYPGDVPIEVGMELRKDEATSSSFQYDEYVVFNAEQCRHKYLVKVTVVPKNIAL